MVNLLATIPYPQFDPVALRLGPLAVRWYGLAYLTAFLLAYGLLRRMIRRGRLRLSREDLGELVGWLAGGVIVVGRLGWWVFYHRSEGAAEPWYEPLALWHGGMSFHGGLVGVAAALLLWSWRSRATFWNLAECLALVTPVGLFLGRLANFVNAELVGRPTSVPWGMFFPGDSVARHPSQLYEAALEGPLLLALLWMFRHRRRVSVEGRTAALFLILYGILRFAVEFTRQPDPQLGFVAFGWLSMGQLLSGALVAVGTILWISRGRAASGSAERIEPVPAPSHSSKEFTHDGQNNQVVARGGAVVWPRGMLPQGRHGLHEHEAR